MLASQVELMPLHFHFVMSQSHKQTHWKEKIKNEKTKLNNWITDRIRHLLGKVFKSSVYLSVFGIYSCVYAKIGVILFILSSLQSSKTSSQMREQIKRLDFYLKYQFGDRHIHHLRPSSHRTRLHAWRNEYIYFNSDLDIVLEFKMITMESMTEYP